ncbi:peptidoglycan recognition family protein [Nonomuraea sp. NEAU-A123]|uniref:peptidoglycan recognition protein family protein n=1 Tax=Nonomuraea sp. NEAU-A123 TaxID=2839649 RepID=UPI001BE42678|nr:peptidoglycan recognition family protein [Nonomuraea sp. NEAU-A123]MBT2234741.1 peptidoglycan recognition protein family protein [Nonomuraea sp. NEAU-A123]
MPWLTQLADVARKTGFPVTEVGGWKTRGHGPQPSVEGVVCHHTAGWNDRGVVVNGRPGLSGPLSHVWLQHTGRIWVVAAGRCWHNAPSTSPHHMNSTSLGIEAENDGHTPWPSVQIDAYHALCAELCREFGVPASSVRGHKEVNTQKPDPHSLNMSTFRSRVAALLKSPGTPINQQEEDMPEVISLGAGEDQSVPAGDELAVRWHTEYTDDPNAHGADGTAVLSQASRWCIVDGLVKVRGLAPGAEIDVAWSRYSRDGKQFEDDAWRLSFRADVNGRVEESVGGQFSLNTKNQLRLRVINPREDIATAVVEKVSMAKIAMFNR